MSVRAYRINRIDIEDDPTFNLWQEQEICDRLVVYEALGEEGCGVTEVSVDKLKELLADKSFKMEAETREALQKDLDWAIAGEHEYIQYDCF